MKKWKAPKGYIEKKYNYTYKLIFKYDRRYYYYGTHSSNIEPKYDNYSGSGTLVKQMKKQYGKDCFERKDLEFFSTKEEALISESNLVTEDVIKDTFCLNRIVGGGTFDTTGIVMSDEFRKMTSERFKGKKRTEESIRKMIETRRKRGTDKHSEETKKKLSEIKTGLIPISKNGELKWITKDDFEQFEKNGWRHGYPENRNEKIAESKLGKKNPMFGKKWDEESKKKMVETKYKNGTNFHSEETKEKLARINREHAKDPEFRKKLSEACVGVNNWSKGRKRIYKGEERKMVKEEELDKYLKDGWKQGLGYKSR